MFIVNIATAGDSLNEISKMTDYTICSSLRNAAIAQATIQISIMALAAPMAMVSISRLCNGPDRENYDSI